MKYIINFTLFTLWVVILFSGCSSKQYFEPETTHSFNQDTTSIDSSIKTLGKYGATLDNNKFISKNGISKLELPKGYHFLNNIDNTILATNNENKLLFISNNKQTTINFKNKIISASKRDDLLALVFDKNIVGLYSIEDKKFKLKESLKSSILNDIRVASPIFLDDIVLLPTLDGKVLIVNIEKNTIIKTINIDPNGKINNIIFLDTINDTMIAATTNKIMSLFDSSFAIKDYTIKNIIASKENIFIATLDGNIIKLDFALEEINKKKFKFANIHSLIYSNSLYALESEGFLININDDFTDIKVYDFSFDNEEKVISIDDTLYFEDSYIKLK